jgi:NTE family protein
MLLERDDPANGYGEPVVEGAESESPRRRGTALCLSGGGFRAALFHLGALTRLNELGVLGRIDTISAVSGGSIIAAHLVTRLGDGWPEPGAVILDWEERVARPFREFAAADLRTGPILSWFRRLLPGRPERDVAAQQLERAYVQRLTDLRLDALPARPRLILSATDVVFGTNFVFDTGRNRLGDWQAGYIAPLPPWPLARAVAASSCFPPAFAPLDPKLDPTQLKGGAYRGVDRDQLLRGLRLSDGGLYDNMGLEPVWKDHARVLVSDGGRPFSEVVAGGLLEELGRYVAITERQARGLRLRWLHAQFGESGGLAGAYWGIAQRAGAIRHGAAGYSAPLAEDLLPRIRTDLDGFSQGEIGGLVNHGYGLADAVIRRRFSHLASHPEAPWKAPHPEWLDERTLADALAESHRRRVFGR